ncbi:hypothetical protein Q8A67_003090 [Cirrhinus molitorella]|uniref:Uncharacterized protein n=1 Tax=Cirrhinus molitorella TaxID=172907 RepID=A0AA88Q8E9_9TELE|nr:hypothetical protein Q8A67_003090 [Cirrhinus molitorella]
MRDTRDSCRRHVIISQERKNEGRKADCWRPITLSKEIRNGMEIRALKERDGCLHHHEVEREERGALCHMQLSSGQDRLSL